MFQPHSQPQSHSQNHPYDNINLSQTVNVHFVGGRLDGGQAPFSIPLGTDAIEVETDDDLFYLYKFVDGKLFDFVDDVKAVFLRVTTKRYYETHPKPMVH